MTKVGDTLGRFRVEAALGGGAFGAVFRGFDPLVGEAVALKVLRPELTKDDTQTERLRREVLLARRVHHPGVCRIHDLQQDGDALFVVMELVEGETLEALLGRGPLPPLRASKIVERVCRALAAAHDVSVLHRDVKASNVMVRGDDDQVTLVDFGIATGDGLEQLTRPGIAMGTVGYVAPELWEGQAASRSSDVFAAGVLLYASLTARLPWRGFGPAVLQQMRHVPAAPPSVYAPAVDGALDALVLRAIAIDPGARFPSALALAEALAAWRTASSFASRPRTRADATTPLAQRGRGGRRALLVGAGLAAAVGALALVVDTVARDDVEARAPARSFGAPPSVPSPSAARPFAATPDADPLPATEVFVAAPVVVVDDVPDDPSRRAAPRARAARPPPDRASVEAKLARLQARAGSTSDARLDRLAVKIADDIAARRYADADAKLDRALALVR